jgi:hypothetical protein
MIVVGMHYLNLSVKSRKAQKLNIDASFSINVVGNYIYYWDNSDNNYIYRIQTDGTDRQIVQ